MAVKDIKKGDLIEIEKLFDRIYPVGSLFFSALDQNPSTLFGGSWKKISEGRVIQGSDASHAAGTTINAGLPNITGRGGMGECRTYSSGIYYEMIAQASGAFYWDKSRNFYGSGGGLDQDDALMCFDASRSNSIYGASSTVQPPAYVVNIWQRVA